MPKIDLDMTKLNYDKMTRKDMAYLLKYLAGLTESVMRAEAGIGPKYALMILLFRLEYGVDADLPEDLESIYEQGS